MYSVTANSVLGRLRARIDRSPILTRLLEAAAWSLVGIAASRAATVVASVLAARWLEPEAFGALGIIQSTLGMFQVVANLGLGLTATKFVAQLRTSDPARAGRIVGLSQAAAWVLGGVAAAAVVAAAGPLAKYALAKPELERALQFSAPLVLLGSVAATQLGVLAGFGAFRRLASVYFVSAVATLIFVVGGVATLGLNGAIGGLIAALVAQVIAGSVQVRREAAHHGVIVDVKGGLSETAIIGRFSLPATLASLVTTPAIWISQALLVHAPGGLADMAVLNAANQWFNVMSMLPMVLAQPSVSILAERVAAGDRVGIRRLVSGVTKLSALSAGALALGLSAASPLLMGLYGTNYRQHPGVLAVSVFAGFLFVVQSPVGNVVVAAGRMWLGLVMNLAWGLVLIASAFALDRYGALGIAGARAVAYLAHLVWSTIAMLSVLHRPPAN